jgi:hypothetical protein
LYQKADYDGAMQQYLKAIDNTEPSQVIRKVRSSIYFVFEFPAYNKSSLTLRGYTT